jgi:uncharacterized membrane-anchored protein YhcB (DUF1043 family)
MTTIPEICMEYTKVFTVLKLELFIALVAGVLIGYWVRRLGE